MAVRSLNKVTLIGNLTRDPELRYTPNGTAVATFTVATNREWTLESGEKREEAEFTRIVSWNKLAELCNQLLSKGRKVYVEGRLQTRTWTGQDGNQRTTTEVVIHDMIVLDSRKFESGQVQTASVSGATRVKKTQGDSSASSQTKTASSASSDDNAATSSDKKDDKSSKEKSEDAVTKEDVKEESEEVNPDDIPF